MRYYEFAIPAKPILKISQQKQALANTPTTTPPPTNTQPTPAPTAPIKVYPRAWQRDWLQRHLAAQIAKNAQTITPTSDDIAIAYFKYGQAQSAADSEYEQKTGKTTDERRWVKRD